MFERLKFRSGSIAAQEKRNAFHAGCAANTPLSESVSSIRELHGEQTVVCNVDSDEEDDKTD